MGEPRQGSTLALISLFRYAALLAEPPQKTSSGVTIVKYRVLLNLWSSQSACMKLCQLYEATDGATIFVYLLYEVISFLTLLISSLVPSLLHLQ